MYVPRLCLSGYGCLYFSTLMHKISSLCCLFLKKQKLSSYLASSRTRTHTYARVVTIFAEHTWMIISNLAQVSRRVSVPQHTHTQYLIWNHTHAPCLYVWMRMYTNPYIRVYIHTWIYLCNIPNYTDASFQTIRTYSISVFHKHTHTRTHCLKIARADTHTHTLSLSLQQKTHGRTHQKICVLIMFWREQGKLSKLEDDQDKDLDQLSNLVGQLKSMGTVSLSYLYAYVLKLSLCVLLYFILYRSLRGRWVKLGTWN